MKKGTKSWHWSTAKHLDPKSLTFSIFTADDIRKLSVTKITTPLSFNILGHPLRGGLYDPALGPVEHGVCTTCVQNIHNCSGHFGHIELPVPVVNPLFHKTICSLIKMSCLHCFTLQIDSTDKLLLSAKVQLLREGYFCDLVDLEREVSTAVSAATREKVEEVNEHVQKIIDLYIENLRNKDRFKINHLRNDEVRMTKNINIQWQTYIDGALKHLMTRTNTRRQNICKNCTELIPKLTIMRNKILAKKEVININEGEENEQHCNEIKELQSIMITPDQSKEYLRKLWENDKDILKVIVPCLETINAVHPTDVFFFDVVPVIPPIVRPTNFVNGQIIENSQTQSYKKIVENCLVLKNVIQAIQDGDTEHLPEEGKIVFNQIRGASAVEKLHNAWQELQANVDHLMDSELNKTADSASCQGLKQLLEKKEGVIRMHMMGKRVNYAARSVITPDPNLNVDEIGIPEAFATKLTYPVPVTPHNVMELRQLILNGPNVHPGAVLLTDEEGRVTRITANNYVQREAMAKRLLTTTKSEQLYRGAKIVHRHLQNGDILLLNRQPTLHKPSIMAHKARILKGEKTLRLHYANCKAYNADFDGDEMNAHFPQSELARSEGYEIANVSKNYLVPKDGTPLSGLIQDHMIGGVRLTMRGKFFSRQDYMQFVYSALSMVQGTLVLLPPAIIKPVPLWSGKQVVSTVIQNIIPRGQALINLTASTKISDKEWQIQKPRRWKCGQEFMDPKTMSEAEVIIRNGELLCGVLDKMHYGATPFGLIHCIFELYGGTCSSKMLSAFGKLFQFVLQLNGFTLGIKDILVKAKSDAKRTEIISRCRKTGDEIQKSLAEMEENSPKELITAKIEELYWKNPKFRTQADRKYKSILDVYTNDINKTCLPAGLVTKFPANNLQLMVQSGAKGSTVNTMQISCLLGQIELEGKRPPLMISGKSLPSFPPYDPTPRAGGFIDGRFMTGIQPQEFFFHCMAGREGLIDTAVKTSRSGYLQRCLIKHLEGLKVNYDFTVRDSDGSLVQMAYGEDGLDISKSRFLRKDQLNFLIENRKAIVTDELLANEKDISEIRKLNKLRRKISKWEKKYGSPLEKRRVSPFSKFSTDTPVKSSSRNEIITTIGRSKASYTLMKKWVRADEEIKQKYEEECMMCPDPMTSKYRQGSEFGVLSEYLEKMISDHLNKESNHFTTYIGKEELKDLLSAKVMRSVCLPAEPVGLLAAQSIGEPSTQMTLNTFHFAGRGEMNVTLGIPRLREILMLATKNIKTPSMEIPFKKNLPNLTELTDKIRIKLTKCVLSDILQCIKIERKLEHSAQRRLVYTVSLEFLPRKSYKNEFCVHPQQILGKAEVDFFKQMFKHIQKESKRKDILFYDEERKRSSEKTEETFLDENGPEENVPAEKSSTKLELGEMHESSDEEEIAEDADATTTRTVSRHQENQEYEDPEDEEIDDTIAEKDDDEDNVQMKQERVSEEEENDYDYEKRDMNSTKIEQHKIRIMSKVSPNSIDYEFDSQKYLWCKYKFWLPLEMIKIHLPTILRSVANKVVLWETPCIKKAFTFQNPKGETILKTDGINIAEMFKYNEIIDLQKLYSNDIYGISQTYGIEAANRVIIKEVKDVFKMYGITVDSRHLSLIADYMTFDGTFKPLSRKGMEDSASPLQQMSFESSLAFLKNATLQGKQDDLISPSSRLMLGQPCKSGTGMFDVLMRMSN